MRRTQWEGGHLQARKKVLLRNQQKLDADLELPVSITVRECSAMRAPQSVAFCYNSSRILRQWCVIFPEDMITELRCQEGWTLQSHWLPSDSRNCPSLCVSSRVIQDNFLAVKDTETVCVLWCVAMQCMKKTDPKQDGNIWNNSTLPDWYVGSEMWCAYWWQFPSLCEIFQVYHPELCLIICHRGFTSLFRSVLNLISFLPSYLNIITHFNWCLSFHAYFKNLTINACFHKKYWELVLMVFKFYIIWIVP